MPFQQPPNRQWPPRLQELYPNRSLRALQPPSSDERRVLPGVGRRRSGRRVREGRWGGGPGLGAPRFKPGGGGAAAAVLKAGAGGAADGPPDGPPGGSVGSLIVGAAEGFGGKLIRTVSFLGWTLPVSFFGGTAPPGMLGISAIIVVSTKGKSERCHVSRDE